MVASKSRKNTVAFKVELLCQTFCPTCIKKLDEQEIRIKGMEKRCYRCLHLLPDGQASLPIFEINLNPRKRSRRTFIRAYNAAVLFKALEHLGYIEARSF